MQAREASPSVTSKTEAARMLERRIRAVSLGAGLAKCRKDPPRLFVQCFSEQFEELVRSKTPGLVHELSSLGSCGSTSSIGPPLMNGDPFQSVERVRIAIVRSDVRETKRTPLRDNLVPRVSDRHTTSELLVLPHWRHFDGLNAI
jgi:hypothetical protein